jgi:DNA-binding response OmpR family regulator
VLIADDDKAVTKLLTAILTRNGFSVEVVQNGEEAIALLDTTSFEAIVLDLMMPRVDGFEVIAHLERTAPDRLSREVIVLTAVSARDLRKLDGRRVFRVLRKPFDLGELVAAVTSCVDGH